MKAIVNRTTDFIKDSERLYSPVVCFSEVGSNGSALTLTVLAKASSDNWKDYLQLKQDLIAQTKSIITIVNNFKQSVSIAYDTSIQKRQALPTIIRTVVESDSHLKLGPCRLSTLSDYSLDFTFMIETSHKDIGPFLDSIARMKEGILQAFEDHKIEIPFPTTIEIQK